MAGTAGEGGSASTARAPGAEIPVRSKDRGLHIGLLYGISLYLSRIVALTLFDLRVRHVERVPRSGAAILACTHQSVLDPWLVGQCLERRAAYLARQTLFQVPFLGWLIRQYDAFPVPRESIAPRAALEVCMRVLEKGRALILFPEGTRSYDGRLQPLKRGIVLLARRTGAPVVPVLLAGSGRCWPRSRKLPRPGEIRIVFGNPIYFASDESSDSFVERLSGAYRRLAVEAGAEDMLPGGSRAEGSTAMPSPSMNPEERMPPLEAAAAERPPSPPDGAGEAVTTDRLQRRFSET